MLKAVGGLIVVGWVAGSLSACGNTTPSVLRPSEPIVRMGTFQVGTPLGNTPPIPFTIVFD